MGVFQGNQSNQKVASCCFRNFFINGGAVYQHISGNFSFVTVLFKGNAKYVFGFAQFRNVVRVNFDYVVGTVTFGFENCQSFFGVARSDNAVGYFASQHSSSFFVANVGQGNEVTIGAHTVSATSTSVSSCQRGQFQVVNVVDFFQGVAHRHSNSSTSRANVFEGSSSRKTSSFFQFFNQLPAIESVQEVDKAGTTVQHFDGQFFVIFHINASFSLVGVATIFQC